MFSFTPLETALIAFSASVLTAILAKALATRTFITRAECLKNHLAADLNDKTAATEISEIKGQINMVLQMIRGMIVYSDLSKDIQEKILNTRVDRSDT